MHRHGFESHVQAAGPSGLTRDATHTPLLPAMMILTRRLDVNPCFAWEGDFTAQPLEMPLERPNATMLATPSSSSSSSPPPSS